MTQGSSTPHAGAAGAENGRGKKNSGNGRGRRTAAAKSWRKKTASWSSCGGVVLRVQTIDGRQSTLRDITEKMHRVATQYGLEIVSWQDRKTFGFLIRSVFCRPRKDDTGKDDAGNA